MLATDEKIRWLLFSSWTTLLTLIMSALFVYMLGMITRWSSRRAMPVAEYEE
jgi:hypothetical protein